MRKIKHLEKILTWNVQVSQMKNNKIEKIIWTEFKFNVLIQSQQV